MPHIIIETSDQLLSTPASSELLEKLGQTAAKFDTVKPETLKLRHKTCPKSYSYSSKEEHIHISFMLLTGRSHELKEQMAKQLYEVCHSYVTPMIEDCSISVEVKELQTYYKG